MHPAALVPSKAAAADLLQVAKDLRLVRGDAGEGAIIRGENYTMIREANKANEAAITANFPARIEGFALFMPAMILNFFRWHVIPAQVVSILLTGDYWVRIVVNVTATADEALNNLFPVDVTWNDLPRLEVVPHAEPLPENAPGAGYGDLCDYYIYVLRITDGVITFVYPSTFINGGPIIATDPPG